MSNGNDKYHVVILPKYRKKGNFKENRTKIGKIIRELCRQKGIEMLEGSNFESRDFS